MKSVTAICWLILSCGSLVLVQAQETETVQPDQSGGSESTEQESSYSAQTNRDVAIPIDQLQILVRPLTRAELEEEAKGWFQTLHDKCDEIAARQIEIKAMNEAEQSASANGSSDSDTDSSNVADQAEPPPGDETTASQDGATSDDRTAQAGDPGTEPAADPAADPLEQKRNDLLENVVVLQDDRTAIIDRLDVVLASLEAKGGEVKEYHDYIAAVSGIQIDASDVSGTWTAISGWLKSEEGGRRWLWNFVKFFTLMAFAWIAAKIIEHAVNWLLEKKLHLTKLLENLISRTVKNIVLLIGLAVALTALEVDITPILAAIGATGFIVGFALQGTLSNFASGLMILVNRPFDVGDVVNAADVTGTVHEMNLVSTTFRTFDNQTIHVPNNNIWGNVITNITANDTRRVDMEFGIGYEDDFEKAEQILREIVEAHELVLDDPEPAIVTHLLADSSVNIVCRPWSKTSDWWKVKTDVTREVKKRFDEAGISIPFPQRDIHVYQHSADQS